MQIVSTTLKTAEVRLNVNGAIVRIGRVASENGRWFWQHKDGEQSSPFASTRNEAANALAHYHREFKPRPLAMPERRLLFG
jgi:hypothetical protein